ncbi:hypothetical protein A7K50_01375 [Dehalobacter sp. MCB1]|uniref:type I restriction enzyme HsdR N-terminal domain-containing protein n=1 Tax=unclassified Dehalobacter TaxID=2635733 RepID=UPI000E6C98CE|nr:MULTISPECIES: type I restriction enzyme HsdR N-terminal domain-containing protein [unclassified Dehalobacter]RJE47922.1 hypothetical protein A7K50_01375 [Dehalobacter sp. MCB1]TCX56099.1 hypothetical protein C1I38_00855 [Dehalobacter sp. 12DCB1]
MIQSTDFRKQFSKIQLPAIHNNGSHFLDPFRKRLVPVTPEEKVRQRTACYIRDVLRVPEHMIFLEEHLSHYGIDKNGRVDIVICEEKEETRMPITIVECKSESVGLSDQALEQATNYANDLFATYVIISDGNEISCYAYEEESDNYHLLNGLPTYDEMLKRERLKAEIDGEPFIRTDLTSVSNFLDYDWCIGEDTPPAKHRHIVNLAEALLDCSHKIPIGTYTGGIEFLADLGLSYRRYGDASGSDFGSGVYRLLHIKLSNRESNIYGFSIQTVGKTENDPKYGNLTGKSVLIVSVSGDQTDEMLVQINLNVFLQEINDKLIITHNGKFGMKNARSEEFRSRIQEFNPDLINNGRVLLGTLPADKLLYMDDLQMTELLVNLIRYCDHRNRYKAYLRNRNK